ncbi:mCG147363 [Mus musculus]|jgi:hypothetical protein|nr:mCG147363 [Mus musculus]
MKLLWRASFLRPLAVGELCDLGNVRQAVVADVAQTQGTQSR